jgi:RNA polymerase sigma factor (sigma-70 family)
MDSLAACICPPEADGAIPYVLARSEVSLQQRIEPHLPRIRSVARRLLGCDHLALDAVQEALVALWREPHEPIDPAGWLVRAVVHRSKHLRRSVRRRRHHEHAASVACELHRGCDNPLHTAYAHELGAQIEAALANLPAEQRTAMQLTLDTGMGYEAIAQRLGWPLGTVRSRLHRARLALQGCLRGTLREHDGQPDF